MTDRISMKTTFTKTIKKLSHRHNQWQVFSDFCEMSAIAIYNAIAQNQEKEQQYLNIVKRYNKNELHLFPKLLGCTINALEKEPRDFLGTVFGELELYNKLGGQFFTPHPICMVAASVMFGSELKAKIKEQGFITLSEPACGAGFNPQQQLHVTAVDVSAVAAHMAYIQLSLLNIPATVVIGNTLSLKEYDHLLTPAHMTGLWDYKLKRKLRQTNNLTTEINEPPQTYIVESARMASGF